MVTFAQAQERAERWINGDVPPYEHREIRVREFDLGFVVWAEPREDGPADDGSQLRVVIARDSGEATLWPPLPVGELIRRYEEEYGAMPQDTAPEPPQRIDLEATSFLLSPPEWLQEAADRMGIPDRRSGSGGGSGAGSASGSGAGSGSGSGSDSGSAGESGGGIPAQAADLSSGGVDYVRRPASEAAPAAEEASGGVDYVRRSGAPAAPAVAAAPAQEQPQDALSDEPEDGGSWAGKTVSDSGEGSSVPMPATVFAPPISGADLPEAPPAPESSEARTKLLPSGSGLPPTLLAPEQSGPPAPPPAQSGPPVPPPAQGGVPHTMGGSAYPAPDGPAVPLPPPVPQGGGQSAADIAGLATAKATPVSHVPLAPPAPSAPSAPSAQGTPPPPPYAGQGTPPPAPYAGQGTPPPAPHAGQATPPPAPYAGQATPPPASNDPHYAATMLAGPAVAGPPAGGTPPPPPAPFAAGTGTPPPAPAPAPAPAYGYPQPNAGVPTVGPGYMAVLRYRGADGSEQQMIRRSAPGTPHPEWQILHELRSAGVRPEQVLELHTELESCDLPGGYCTRMIRETWPQVRISHTAPYGRDHASRRQGVQHLLTHQGELHQVAGAPARPQPQRVPMPDAHTVLRVPPVGLDVIGQELAGAFGPQGVFRFDQRAVSRQGVPDIVAQTLMWAGLPMDFGPFFWAQAQPGQPVPTLAELAAARGVQPTADAGSYLVMGNDFGRQLCVQYGTAQIVALPLEGGPAGSPPAAPQFVNSSLPEFARCMALLGRMWRLRIGLTPEQAGHWTVDFQAQLAAQDPAAIASPDNWWSVLIEQMWDGLL
ncbi:SUKH-4 family immunity protein [Streptomyces sp. NPDC004031]